jgi:hypothetical protein
MAQIVTDRSAKHRFDDIIVRMALRVCWYCGHKSHMTLVGDGLQIRELLAPPGQISAPRVLVCGPISATLAALRAWLSPFATWGAT